MRRQSGICIELNHDRSIFLMKNGQFVRGTPAGTPSTGEETHFYPFEKKPAIRWQPIMAPVVAAAAACALFMSALVFPAEEAYGYVQIQINPGVELGINDKYEVVSIRELNSDGHELIRQLDDWEKDPLFEVLSLVFELAVTEQTEQITITSVEENGSELDESIKEFVIAVSSVAKNENMAIRMKEATREQWRKSKEDFVPVGQLVGKAETLKIQKESQVETPGQEAETPSAPKETEPINEQEAPSENKKTKEQKKLNINKQPNKIKESNMEKEPGKPTSSETEKKTVPPAEKKKNDSMQKTEQQQKTPKPSNETGKPSNKPANVPPVQKQEKEKPLETVPKDKPPASKDKEKSAEKERRNSEAPGQQKKKDASASNNSVREKDSHNPPGQEKKKEQATDKSGKEKQKEQKKTESFSKKEDKKGDKEKE